MKRICRAILLVTVTFGLLAGCGAEPIEKGYVQEKSYDDPDTIHHPGYYVPGTPPSTTCTGGYGSVPRTCSTRPGTPGHYVPGWTEHDGPHWKLKLRDCDEVGKEGKTKCREGWKEVTELEYDRYGVDSHYPDPR